MQLIIWFLVLFGVCLTTSYYSKKNINSKYYEILDCQDVLLFIWLYTSVYMLMYRSHFWHLAEFRDTWTFVNRRIKDALDLQKTFQEVSILWAQIASSHSWAVSPCYVSSVFVPSTVFNLFNWNHFSSGRIPGWSRGSRHGRHRAGCFQQGLPET
jgi:ubiquinone biosynthesis protein COQ9